MKTETLSISIHCAPIKIYEFVSDIANLPKWAKTFCKASRKSDGEWIIETPQGPMKLRMAAKNEWGVLDHTIHPEPGKEVYVPMRVVSNGEGSEVIFTLFQQPGMTDEQFDRDQAWVREDLKTLKELMEERK